jgi:hypothetical protein
MDSHSLLGKMHEDIIHCGGCKLLSCHPTASALEKIFQAT